MKTDQLYHCANCNRDYDFATQGAVCPHQLRTEGGRDRLESWPLRSTVPKPDSTLEPRVAAIPNAGPLATDLLERVHAETALDNKAIQIPVSRARWIIEALSAAENLSTAQPPCAGLTYEQLHDFMRYALAGCTADGIYCGEPLSDVYDRLVDGQPASGPTKPAARPCVWRTGCKHQAVCNKQDVCVPGGESSSEGEEVR
jgi:hypothetical protein